MTRFKKILRYALYAGIVVLVLIQFYPYGHSHTNPPVTGEPKWDSPQTKALFDKTCADCHSHNTEWPWYSNVAPVSWLVQGDVEKGRSKFNVSAWGTQKRNSGDEAADEVKAGLMPLSIYTVIHPHARLTDDEKQKLILGLTATFGGEEE